MAHVLSCCNHLVNYLRVINLTGEVNSAFSSAISSNCIAGFIYIYGISFNALMPF